MYKMNRFSLSVVLIMAFFASGCLEFDSVTQPSTAESLETFQVPITINITDTDDYCVFPKLAFKLPNNWSVMDSIEYTGDYSSAIVYDDSVSIFFEESRPSGPDHTWWAGISRVGFEAVEGTSVSGAADIIINDTTGTFSIDYYLAWNGFAGIDSSLGHSITVGEITTAVQETTWGVLKSRR